MAGNVPELLVKPNRFGAGVYIAEDVAKSRLLVAASGRLTRVRSRTSIQVDPTHHAEFGSPVQFINHSCEPNCYLEIPRGQAQVRVIALRDLKAAEELTLDYDTFEYQVEHFEAACGCGCRSCRGRILGFRHLPQHLRPALAPYLAEYLRSGELVQV